MNVAQLRSVFPDEASCRSYFESVIWPDGPVFWSAVPVAGNSP
jgi:hypothetical protein